ncbi:hypothetical protein GQ457_04G017210 [Hibiscus cannabinus]
MAILSRNVRGLGQKETIKTLRYLTDKFQSKVVLFSETKQKKIFLEKIRSKFKFQSSFYIDLIGIGRGLAFWWTGNIDMSILRSCKNVIDTSISLSNK